MAPFSIEHEVGPRACVVRLAGDVDMAVVPELRAGLDGALEAGCANVVLDLSDVVYADSTALGLLVWLDRRLEPLGGRLVLAGANEDVARILELSGLVSVAASITMSGDVRGALDGLELPELPTEVLWSKRVDFAADVNQLASVREEVAEMVATLGFSDSAVFDIKVALGEALANAVRHGAPLKGEGLVGVLVQAFPDRVVIDVMDNGSVSFDGAHRGSDDPYATGGRGISFMRALTDRVDFDASPLGGTLVRLTKHRSPAHTP